MSGIILFDSNTFVAKSKGAFQLSELNLQFKRSYFCSICSNEEKRTSSRKIKKERKKKRKALFSFVLYNK